MARKVASPESVERGRRFHSLVRDVRWAAMFVLCVASVALGAVLDVPQVVMVMTAASVPSGILTGRIAARKRGRGGRDRGAVLSRAMLIGLVLVMIASIAGAILAAVHIGAWQACVFAVVAFACELVIGIASAPSRNVETDR